MKTEHEAARLRTRICKTVEARRSALRIEPVDLARASEIDLSQMVKILRGKAGASVYALERIAKALGWTLAELIAEASAPRQPKRRAH